MVATDVNPDWLRSSDAYGWSAVVRNGLPLFALLWLAPAMADRNMFAPWLLSPAIGLLVYRLTIVMHDCSHYTLFESLRLNKAIGLLLGAISGIDFNSFRNQHWRHHRSYGEAGDPQGFHYLGLGQMTPRELRWHIVKPLLGLNLRHTLAESMLAPRNIARSLRSGVFVVLVLAQLAILAIVTGFGQHPLLAALPLVSTATFGLFFSQLRGIAEHGCIGRAVPHEVRSHEPNWFDRIFLYDINFNYHAEHHAHPQIPSVHLHAMHPQDGQPRSSKSMLSTLRAIFSGSRSSHA